MATKQFQPSHIRHANVGDSIVCADPRQAPQVILSVSPCRSGTTVLLRVFSAAGVESHYQPLKNVLRWKLEAKEADWYLPRSPGETIFVKETLGPYTLAESTFDPLASLLNAGLPPANLLLFIYARTPRQTWLSWRDCWGEKAMLENLVHAFATTAEIERRARDLAIPVTTAVYEALRDHRPAVVVERIFDRLGVTISGELIEKSVAELPPLASANKRVVFPHEPAVFDSWPYLGRAQSSPALSYFCRDEKQLPRQESERIRASGIDALYDHWRRQSEIDLGLAIRPCAENNL